jgi:hypothetical protein
VVHGWYSGETGCVLILPNSGDGVSGIIGLSGASKIAFLHGDMRLIHGCSFLVTKIKKMSKKL